MFRRYVLACSIIMAISIGSATLAYAATAKTGFRTACLFQVFVRQPQTAIAPPPNQDFLDFSNSLAANQVSSAAPTVYAEVGKSQKVRVSDVIRQTQILPTAGFGSFGVSVTDPDRARAKRLANGICEQFVSVVSKNRTAELDRQVKLIKSRITAEETDVRRLLAKPAKKRTASENTLLATQQVSLRGNTFLVAGILSLPPDSISVLRPATALESVKSGSLKRDMLIALLAGVLTCFLVILVGEVVSESRRGPPTS